MKKTWINQASDYCLPVCIATILFTLTGCDYEKVRSEAASKGFDKGQQDGHISGQALGYLQGFTNGLAVGYQQGFTNGLAVGYQQGVADGKLEGEIIGNKNGKAQMMIPLFVVSIIASSELTVLGFLFWSGRNGRNIPRSFNPASDTHREPPLRRILIDCPVEAPFERNRKAV